MRRAWLNKHRLLFIQLPFWLMASESHSSGVKIDRWLPSLHCGLLKLALWCDYRTYLACAPGGKVDLWSYSSFKNHRSWKMNQSRKMLEAAFAAEVDCQTNLTSLLFLEFWFFWLKQMTFKPFFFSLTISRGHLVFCEFRWEPRIVPLLWLPNEECAQSIDQKKSETIIQTESACSLPLMHSFNSFTHSFGQHL